MNKYCVICLQITIEEETWQSFFNKKGKSICELCEKKMQQLRPPKCKVCGRSNEENICFDCIRWKEMYGGKDILDRNLSLFTYDDFMHEIIYTWKYRGDYYIIEAFRVHFKEMYYRLLQEESEQEHKNIVIAPIPLSTERLNERGFNQAEQLANMLHKDIAVLFRRAHSEKQAKKTRIERINAHNPFTLLKNVTSNVI